MYSRSLATVIEGKFNKGKAIILCGPRQSGKTTLMKTLLKDRQHLFLDGDDPSVRQLLNEPNTEQLKSIIGKNKILFIDEAQRIKNIGMTMKIITDQFKDVQLLASGSSSFDLNNKTSESLTGKKWEYTLLPLSWKEFEDHHGFLVSEQQVEHRLLFGFYPDVMNHPGEEIVVLKNLVNSYLYRDILAYSDIRKPEVLERLLQALALQIGREVNYNELAQIVGVDKNTVSKYIDILQKGYIVFKLGTFSGNIRNEIKMNKKIYFYDNGLRNMLIGNFSRLDLRNDKGAIWENFLISERLKYNLYTNDLSKMYFWRTSQQQEIDLVEVNEGKISAYEFKWSPAKTIRLPKTFTQNYRAETFIINRNNFRSFLNNNARNQQH